MSGAMRKIGEYLGLLEDTGRYDDELDEDLYEPAAVGQSGAGGPREGRPAPVADLAERRRPTRSRPRPAARSPSSPGSPRSTRAPTTRRAPSARTSARARR